LKELFDLSLEDPLNEMKGIVAIILLLLVILELVVARPQKTASEILLKKGNDQGKNITKVLEGINRTFDCDKVRCGVYIAKCAVACVDPADPACVMCLGPLYDACKDCF
jgi:hypothetical protein